MSYANPTNIRIGVHARFEGHDYRVLGRSVMGETEDGETYYWNEFNLETSSGEEATLVYEETERGGQWRLFTLFDPEYPMTAADAATKEVGDPLNLTGEDVRVTFRSRSRVYFIEGKGPEGEKVGSVAEYFNAEAAGVMQVVSWTGDEVEFYHGTTLTRGMVTAAFGFPPAPDTNRSRWLATLSGARSGSGSSSSNWTVIIFAGVFIFILLLIITQGFSCSHQYESSPVPVATAGMPPLSVGSSGQLFDKKYHVTAHALMEVDETGVKWEEHEYELADDAGGTALLVCGSRLAGDKWICYEPFFPMLPLSAREAAAKHLGDRVVLDSYGGQVSDIFLTVVKQSNGSGFDHSLNGAIHFGVCCARESQPVLVLWNNAGIQFFHGRTISAKIAAASFGATK